MSDEGRHEDRFLIEKREPAYLALLRSGELARRATQAARELTGCRACPRDCGVDRAAGETGVCGVGRHALVSSAFPHLGEEPCLRGWRGSGTIFFSRCNLACVYCQNWEISQRGDGQPCDTAELADFMLALQARGCHNINLVTPEHVVPQVVLALARAAEEGLSLPVVYNSSAYDSLGSLALLDGLVDIYMPDFKCWSKESARRHLRAEDYPEQARAAIEEMHRQVGVLRMDSAGIARRGVLIRHLVMPGGGEETAAIFRWLAREVSPDSFVNIMGQYRPAYKVGRREGEGTERYSEIDRPPTPDEIDAAWDAAQAAGLWRFDPRH